MSASSNHKYNSLVLNIGQSNLKKKNSTKIMQSYQPEFQISPFTTQKTENLNFNILKVKKIILDPKTQQLVKSI